MHVLNHVWHAFYGQPWALTPEKWQEIDAFLRRRQAGSLLHDEIAAFEAAGNAARQAGVQILGKVATIPLMGVISQRANLVMNASGGTSTEQFGAALDQLVADKSVRSIVMVVDSPGGSVFGVGELAQKVYQAQQTKKVVAVADSMAASAAYWIASQASELVITPGGQVGSIGVIASHTDESKADEMAGVKTTLVTAGKYKGEGDPSQPLSDEGAEQIQKIVNQYYGMFVGAVARGRNTTEHRVQADMGQGRMLTAKDALAAGMVDRIATLDQVLGRLNADPAAGPIAEATELPLAARLAGYRARAVKVT